MFTGSQRRTPKRIRRIKEAGLITLVVQREEAAPAYVTVEAELVKMEQPPTEKQMAAIARRYMPEEHALGFVRGELGDPGNTVTLMTFRPVRWFSFDAAEDS